MVNHIKRIEELISDEGDKATFHDQAYGYAVSFNFGTIIQQNGPSYVGPYWVILVTKKNALLKHNDIMMGSNPLLGPLPQDHKLRDLVRELVSSCQTEQDKQLRGES